MTRVEQRLRTYLEARFPDHRVGSEWEQARNVLVLRLKSDREDQPTFLVEVSESLLEIDSEEELDGLFAWWNLEKLLREHYRVLLTPDAVTPLPWKQLAPERGTVDEASWESFPASDPAPHSSASPGEDEE